MKIKFLFIITLLLVTGSIISVSVTRNGEKTVTNFSRELVKHGDLEKWEEFFEEYIGDVDIEIED